MPTPARRKQFSYLQSGYRRDNTFAQYLKPRSQTNDGFEKYLDGDRNRTRFRTL